MGSILGISDLPATIFTTPLEPVRVPKPIDISLPRKILGESGRMKHDLLVIQSKHANKGLLSKLVNGFRKIV